MTTTTMGTSLVPVAERFAFADAERLALVGFLAGYRGATRDAYRMDLRLFATWCAQLGKTLFEVQRMDIESYARQLESRGRARSTVARRLCTVAGFYRYAEEEGLIDRSPAVPVRRPRLDYESHAIGLDRNELGALPVAAALAGPKEHALMSLLALNGSCAASLAMPGSTSTSVPTRSATRSSPRRSTPVCPCATCKKPPAMPIHAQRCATTAAVNPSTATPRTSSPPSSPVPVASPRTNTD
jgi:hypothetical protein